MIASLKGYGRIARTLLAALGALLVLGIVGSLLMGVHARHSARDQIVHQAQTITDSSLTLAFTPADLTGPASAERASQLTAQIQAIVIDPSDFDSVTLYSPEGTILYSTATSRIGTQLPGEKDSIKEALRGVPLTSEFDGTLSVRLPLRFRSGVGGPAVVELTHPDAPIASAAGPWRTNALFLFALLVLLGVAVFGVARLLAVVSDTADGRVETRPVVIPQPVRAAAPHPGLREEGEARRRAEERARAAEERLGLLQDQYRTTLEELQSFQQLASETKPAPGDARIEERALRAEGQVQELELQLRTVTKERERLATQLQETIQEAMRVVDDDEQDLRLREAELEAIGLNAELAVTKEQLDTTRRELATMRATEATSRSQEEVDAANVEMLQIRDALTTAEAQLASGQRELEDAHTELRALRNEEQRAAMLEDELRAAKAELESGRASHRADLVEREAELEEKVRATREEFQRQLEEIEASYRSQLEQRETELRGRIADAETAADTAGHDLEAVRDEVTAARAEAASREQQLLEAHNEIARIRGELKGHTSEVKERTAAVGQARKEADEMRRSLTALQEDLARSDGTIEELRAELEAERLRNAETEDVTMKADRDRASQQARAEKLVRQLEDAAAENAELNRRLQDFEARRQLELADDQGRAQIDQLLQVTQERLAGQTEKLIAAEDRVKELETDLITARNRLEVIEGDLRMHQMSDALRETREQETADAVARDEQDTVVEMPVEDRRGTTPFMKELSLDAKKSVAKINGITQLLKHKKDQKDQAQLIKQLTGHARRLDNLVADIADAERLASGSIKLNIRRTDMESLVNRVVEEAMADSDHDIRVVAEPVKVRIDQVRTEQILNGLLRASSERTQSGKTIVVRLQRAEGGAMLSVEDPEPSSDASISPVVRRLAEAHGGTVKAESRDGGGSAFRVFLPDPEVQTDAAAAPDVKILVDEASGKQQDEPWEAEAAHQQLAAELRRHAELQTDS
jgi:signal transduction histidine kinase/predicted  nucleic acid-binding Zn-ribbon protein